MKKVRTFAGLLAVSGLCTAIPAQALDELCAKELTADLSECNGNSSCEEDAMAEYEECTFRSFVLGRESDSI